MRWFLSLLMVLSMASLATAQTSGMFGQRTTGGSFTPGASTAFGGAGARGGAGVGAGARGGSVAGATTQADTSAGQLTGSERFIRGNRQAGQFVGSDSADITAGLFNQLGRGMGIGLQQGARDSANQGQSGAAAASRVRTTRIVAFEVPRTDSVAVATRVSDVISRSPRLTRFGQVEVTVVDRTAIVRGVVATSDDRALIQQLVALEAGISTVQNELIVAPPELESRGESPSVIELPPVESGTLPTAVQP